MEHLSSRYEAAEIEEKWYAYWESRGYFNSVPDNREAFSIVIPPPNVTGVLHMGHMLNNTVQDILIRKARLDGKNACWVPGTDHASIATEAKVVHMLREKGIKKSDLTREEFLAHAWEWTDKYGGIILKQLRKLGASCDWSRTAFTMDEPRSASVIKAFVDLYHSGKLYRDFRMVNWDPLGKTVLSNEEVIYHSEITQLCHVKYQIEGAEEFIVVATTRPETIMGDTAVAVHPEDPRYAHLKGKMVIVPIVNRSVPIIFDDYVDPTFGTGALKVTPAHDPNDYEIGKRHDLDVIDVLNEDGTLSELAQVHIGKDREIARKIIRKELLESGAILKTEDYEHNVGRSERTNAVIEPRLSLQWYVDMQQLLEPALSAVMDDTIEFFPKNQKNTYRHWMENIRDWCISRQLWWGHRIPAWYYEDDVFVASSDQEALRLAKEKYGHSLTLQDLRQDEDVLDTWFSSWLWPITCFKGFQSREELDYYFPTSILVTGWDIIFLWVARMIISGYEWEQQPAFHKVYFTGMVRDKQRRKMSKSLGNSPDALELIAQYGADGVRFGVLSSSPAGGDLLFDEKLCEQGRNFCNKMWNALRLLKGWQIDPTLPQPEANELACRWFESRINDVILETEHDYAQYRLSDITIKLYSLVWDDFCSWYLEMIKPPFGEAIDPITADRATGFFEIICQLLHPLMPFVSEEIWHQLYTRAEGEDCIVSAYPKAGHSVQYLNSLVHSLQQLITKIRETRNVNGVSHKEALSLFVQPSEQMILNTTAARDLVSKLANLSSVHLEESFPTQGSAFLAENEKYFLQFTIEVSVEEEQERIQKEINYARGFIASIEKKLSNEKFVSSAPKAVVEKEQQKLADGQERLKILKENLAQLM